jgi:hypothetical protein
MNEPQKLSAAGAHIPAAEGKYKRAYWDLPDESNRVLVECRKMMAANKMRSAWNR